MREMIRVLMEEESGQGMVEYALILLFIAVALMNVIGTVASPLKADFKQVADELKRAL